jgi:hypothetical protein
LNGRINSEVTSYDLTPEDEIRRRIALLDGVDRFSWNLWSLPDGVPFDRLDLRSWPQEYIQAAGSPDRMMVEIREIADVLPRQLVLGHGTEAADSQGVPKEIVRWNGCETTVRSHEVFEASEVAELFVAYYRTGDVSADYTRRPLDPSDTTEVV